MTLAAVDLVVATCVACTTLALLLPLTFTAIILTPALKHFGLAPAAATSAHAAPADGTLLRLMRPMLQLYGAMVILGGACARVGASASALSVPIFHALSRDATLVAFLKQPLGPLDACFLFGALPLLCVPALIFDGAGGGSFVYIFVAIYWRHGPASPLQGILALILLYNRSAALGFFSPLADLDLGDVILCGALSALFCTLPPHRQLILVTIVIAATGGWERVGSLLKPHLAMAWHVGTAIVSATCEGGRFFGAAAWEGGRLLGAAAWECVGAALPLLRRCVSTATPFAWHWTAYAATLVWHGVAYFASIAWRFAAFVASIVRHCASVGTTFIGESLSSIASYTRLVCSN